MHTHLVLHTLIFLTALILSLLSPGLLLSLFSLTRLNQTVRLIYVLVHALLPNIPVQQRLAVCALFALRALSSQQKRATVDS